MATVPIQTERHEKQCVVVFGQEKMMIRIRARYANDAMHDIKYLHFLKLPLCQWQPLLFTLTMHLFVGGAGARLYAAQVRHMLRQDQPRLRGCLARALAQN